MFKCIKNLFCKPQEQYFSFIHIIYEISPDVPSGFEVVKPKRKYTKRKKIKIKTKKGRK